MRSDITAPLAACMTDIILAPVAHGQTLITSKLLLNVAIVLLGISALLAVTDLLYVPMGITALIKQKTISISHAHSEHIHF